MHTSQKRTLYALLCLPVLLLLLATTALGQQTRKVLFLGNSYTYYNNMPQMVATMAAQSGDTLLWTMEAPGGAFLSDHLNRAASLNQIKKGDWDYVALQEQSQALTLPDYQIGFTLRSIYALDSTINFHNACVETLYYLTWGRKNGDKVFYRVYSGYTDSTYEYMDSLLLARYLHVADTNQGEVSPAGAVWRYIRDNHPNLELYQSDESHPSLLGSYVAACAFYTSIFRKDPTLLTYNAGLAAADAQIVRNATKTVVYNQLLHWNIGKFDSLKDPGCNKISLTEASASPVWQVYPNPANTALVLELGTKGTVHTFRVYKADGQLYTVLKVKGTITLDISTWPKGLYVLQGSDGSSTKFLKH
jgi:hypothetical protein